MKIKKTGCFYDKESNCLMNGGLFREIKELKKRQIKEQREFLAILVLGVAYILFLLVLNACYYS